MFRLQHPRLAGIAVSVGVGLLLLAVMPEFERLGVADLKVFERLAGKPDAVLGEGSLEAPRQIEVFGDDRVISPPEMLFLDENPGKYFESMPPPPSDMAVALVKLQQRGAKAFGVSYPLQWEDPDSLALETMRGVMDRFEGAVLGFPLKDSTAPEPVASPFQLASIPYAAVGGDGTKLPVVNGIRGVAPELGGSKTWAGFTRLENEKPEENRAYLLARWDDRVIFSLPLALEIARYGVPVEEVRVIVGKEIRLGAEGARIPIDFRGRTVLPSAVPEQLSVPASGLISDLLPEDFGDDESAVYFTDQRTVSPREERDWTALLPKIDQVVRTAPHRNSLVAVPRPEPLAEMLALVGVSLLVGASLSSQNSAIRFLVGGACLVLVAGGLVFMIRGLGLAPMPLAFMAVPLLTYLVGEWVHLTRRVEVVDSEETRKTRVVEERKPSGKGKRRKKRRQ